MVEKECLYMKESYFTIMNEKELKIIGKLDRKSRVTTKELGKLLRGSQQSANYLIHKIEGENYFIKYKTQIDSAKFGLSKVIVFYNYTNFKDRRKIISYFKSLECITIIEECSEGFDLLLEFTTPNLSSFNKENRAILHKFKESLQQMNIYPIIVKHDYGRKYLLKGNVDEDIVTSGDRNIEQISSREKLFLKLIQNKPREAIINIASKMKCDPKTAILIKKRLEKRKIIRIYGISINTPKMNISRTHVLLSIDLSDSQDIDVLIEFLKRNNNVIRVQKIIGNYEIILTIESIDNYSKVLTKIRNEFKITKHKVITTENIIKEKDIPEQFLS